MTDLEEKITTTVELETIKNAFTQRSMKLFDMLQTPEGKKEMSDWTFVQNASKAWLMEQGLRDEVTRLAQTLKQDVTDRRAEKDKFLQDQQKEQASATGHRRSERIFARTHHRGNQ